jgi:hypothetical protein
MGTGTMGHLSHMTQQLMPGMFKPPAEPEPEPLKSSSMQTENNPMNGFGETKEFNCQTTPMTDDFHGGPSPPEVKHMTVQTDPMILSDDPMATGSPRKPFRKMSAMLNDMHHQPGGGSGGSGGGNGGFVGDEARPSLITSNGNGGGGGSGGGWGGGRTSGSVGASTTLRSSQLDPGRASGSYGATSPVRRSSVRGAGAGARESLAIGGGGGGAGGG